MMRRFGEHPEAGKRMPRPSEQRGFCAKVPGYLGAWHAQPPLTEHGWKYSGGLGTYTCSHAPMAIHAPQVEKTFFCWGGMAPGQSARPRNWDFCPGQQVHMVSYYDHRTGLVPQPTAVFDKWCADTHDNPVIAIDDDGYIWLFSPSHGAWTTPSFIHRSCEPWSIDRFETVAETLFAYPQPRWLPGHGFVFLHARYQRGRMLHVQRSRDGRAWSEPRALAGIEQGHYHVSAVRGRRIGMAFNVHPAIGGLDARTNIYYLQSDDAGEIWTTIDGRRPELPLREVGNPALAADLQAAGELAYLMDMAFDAQGRPVILHLLARTHVPGPDPGGKRWRILHWDGAAWVARSITASHSSYDCGCLHLDGDVWRVIGPTEDGPRPYGPGGEVALWRSDDAGASWRLDRQLTKGSEVNHTYVRPVENSHPDVAALWSDGDTDRFSQSFLYICDRDGRNVRRLPPCMTGPHAQPEELGPA